MSKQAVEIDILAEVLKTLSKKKTVKPDDAEKAIIRYNQLIEELNKLKKPTKTEDRLKSEISKRDKIIETQKKEINELNLRLSAMMGQQIKSGNADIADLSDEHRPTKLAEQFKTLYDDEWTRAYEEMESKKKGEKEMIDILKDVVTAVNMFCTGASNEYMDHVFANLKHDITVPSVTVDKKVRNGGYSELDSNQEDKLKKVIIDIRKEFAELAVGPLIKIYDIRLKEIMKVRKLPASMAAMNVFVERLLNIVWRMKVQDPAICLQWQEAGQPVDRERFTYYTQRGDTVSYCVWPAVLLHEGGPLMSKGIVQGK